jgi:hypothetical protein
MQILFLMLMLLQLSINVMIGSKLTFLPRSDSGSFQLANTESTENNACRLIGVDSGTEKINDNSTIDNLFRKKT